MGLYLAMSSVVGAKPAEVEACVADYVAGRQGTLERSAAELPEEQEARLLESGGGVTLVYPSHFTEWDEVSAKLSVDLKKPENWTGYVPVYSLRGSGPQTNAP